MRVTIATSMATQFFRILEKSMMPGDWGDYGHILQHGMACHSPRINGRLVLERTGPYIPPITFPGIGEIVLTAKARAQLESSGLTGYGFAPVTKLLTVELHWENWDLSLYQPPYYPDSGEPEDYVLGHPDSPAASQGLGNLWEITVPPTAIIARGPYDLSCLDVRSWDGSDLFKGEGYGSVLFSERARDWFSDHWSEFVDFEEFPAL